MRMALDIHHFDQQYQRLLASIEHAPISERNRQLIRRYCDVCQLRQVCGRVRLLRVINALTILAKLLGKDFDQATRADLETLISGLLNRQPAYSVATISTYKKILRRFLAFVLRPDEFPRVKTLPEEIAWINGHIPRRDRSTIRRSDLLTPAEVEQLLRATTNERDRAFIAILWEAGPRISEIGNMQRKHVTSVANGYTIDITGKTGTRTPLIVSSAPHLAAWLAVHPFQDPEAPLWVRHRDRTHVKYTTITSMLQRLFTRAGINKPFHPHIFRHSRVTYVLANGIMNEQQAKVYFGWTPDSDMPGATYAHLIDADVNNAILRENNLSPHQEAHRELQPVRCSICGQLSPPKSEYCQRCHAVLDLRRAYEHQQLHDLKEQLFTSMFKLMVERGLVDEAAGQIHDAGLGSVLKRLAQQVRETKASQAVKENTRVVKANEVLASQLLTANNTLPRS